jgi:hypothetical protein
VTTSGDNEPYHSSVQCSANQALRAGKKATWSHGRRLGCGRGFQQPICKRKASNYPSQQKTCPMDRTVEVVLARERLRGVRQMHAKQRQQDQLDRAGFSQDKKDA